MPRTQNTMNESSFLEAALEGLELQKQRIEQQMREVQSLLGRRRSRPGGVVEALNGALHERPVKKRQLSEAARKRIAAAQKKRWAEYRKAERHPAAE